MLLNNVGYEIYYGGGSANRRAVRRQSWPRGSALALAPVSAPVGAGLRRALGSAMIGLGQRIAADNRPALAATAGPR